MDSEIIETRRIFMCYILKKPSRRTSSRVKVNYNKRVAAMDTSKAAGEAPKAKTLVSPSVSSFTWSCHALRLSHIGLKGICFSRRPNFMILRIPAATAPSAAVMANATKLVLKTPVPH